MDYSWSTILYFSCTEKWFGYPYVYFFFQILFPFRLLQNTEQNSLCCTVGPSWSSILNIIVCSCQSQTPSLSLPAFPSAPAFVLQVWGCCPALFCAFVLSCSVVLNLCNPMGCSLPGSSVHGIFQARVLEWVVISYSREFSQPSNQTHISSSPELAGRFFTTRLPGNPVSVLKISSFASFFFRFCV